MSTSSNYRHLGGNMSDADFALRLLRRAVETEKQAKDGSQVEEILRRFEELDRLITEQGDLPEEWKP